jgi:hypothetical protein
VTTNYTIAEQDVAGPFLPKLPSKMEDMKDIPKLSFTSSREGLAEKFHKHIEFRVGINLRVVVEDDGHLTRDGVNAAARLEGIARPGGSLVCLARPMIR